MSKYYKLQAEIISSGLSARAQILYSVLADRKELSRKSGEKYKDKTGIYIIYPISDLCAVLGLGERTIKYALAELEDAKLISRKKQGKMQPSKIYVWSAENCTSWSAKNCTSGSAENCTSWSAKNCTHNNTDNNNTDISSSSSEEGSERGIIRLIAMIDSIAANEKIYLSDDQIYKLLKKIRKQADRIGNLEAWIKTAIRNQSMLPNSDTEDQEGYAATYDIAEYESQSITDYEY